MLNSLHYGQYMIDCSQLLIYQINNIMCSIINRSFKKID